MKIEPDQVLLMELSKESSGAYVHDSNMFSSIYRNYCNKGDIENSSRLEKVLRSRLAKIRLERVSK